MSFAERFDLQVPLGRTPAGIVWRATRKDDDRTVAVAIADGQGLMDEGLFERVRERFQRDLAALKKAKKGHLPQIHETGEDDAGNPYAAMDLIDGESLVLDDIELGALGTVLDGVLRALEAAHRVQVFHGDIEPGNVLVAADDTATLVGFGANRAFATAEGWNDDDEAHLKRAATYRAPELGPGELPSDPRADLYGVGVLLHQALAGEPPKEGRSVAEVAPELGASMVKLIDRATDPSPQGRYASAWAMRTALSGALRMAAKGEKPPAKRRRAPKTIPGGMTAPDLPKVPRVPSAQGKSSPPPPPDSKGRPSAPPPPKAKASTPPPPPKATKASTPPPTPEAKASTPPPPPRSSGRQKTEPFPIRPEAERKREASVPPPAPKAPKAAKKERPKTVPFELSPDADSAGEEASDTGAGAPSSIPPPVVGVGVDARDSAEPRETTQAISLTDVEVVGDEAPARAESVPPPVPGDEDDELPLPVAPSFSRSPVGLAAVAVIALGLGWAFGRMSAPEPTVDLSEVAAAPTEDAPETEAEPEPEPEPEVQAETEPAEPEPPAPEPLRLGELPEGVEALVDGAPYDPDAPPTLTPAGESVPLVVQRGDQRVRLSLARDEAGALSLNVLEMTEPPEPEPEVAASPMVRPSRRARRRRRATMRRSAMGSSGSLMRPGIAYDPGF
jgi:serine/threonine protein kinase